MKFENKSENFKDLLINYSNKYQSSLDEFENEFVNTHLDEVYGKSVFLVNMISKVKELENYYNLNKEKFKNIIFEIDERKNEVKMNKQKLDQNKMDKVMLENQNWNICLLEYYFKNINNTKNIFVLSELCYITQYFEVHKIHDLEQQIIYKHQKILFDNLFVFLKSKIFINLSDNVLTVKSNYICKIKSNLYHQLSLIMDMIILFHDSHNTLNDYCKNELWEKLIKPMIDYYSQTMDQYNSNILLVQNEKNDDVADDGNMNRKLFFSNFNDKNIILSPMLNPKSFNDAIDYFYDKLIANIIDYFEEIFDSPSVQTITSFNQNNQELDVCRFEILIDIYFNKESSEWPSDTTFAQFLHSQSNKLSHFHLQNLAKRKLDKIVLPSRNRKFWESSNLLNNLFKRVEISMFEPRIPDTFEAYHVFQLGLQIHVEYLQRLIIRYPKSSLALFGTQKENSSNKESNYELSNDKEDRNCNVNEINEIFIRFYTAFLQKYFSKTFTSARELLKFSDARGNIDKFVTVFTDRIDLLTSQNVLLATSDIYDELNENEDEINCIDELYGKELKKEFGLGNYYLNRNPFTFPKCQISETCRQFSQLFYQVAFSILPDENTDVNKFFKSSPRGHRSSYYRLYVQETFKALKDLLESYLTLTPSSAVIERLNIPMYSIVYMNDCVFLAFAVSQLRPLLHKAVAQFFNKNNNTTDTSDFFLPKPDVSLLYNGIVPFVKKLISRGYKNFYEVQLYGVQMKILRDFISEYFDGISNHAAESSGVPNEKALKKCILHLKHLKQVFIQYMPKGVWESALGILIDHLFDECFEKIFGMEDITYECCEAFSHQFDSVFVKECVFQLLIHPDKNIAASELPEEAEELYALAVAKFGCFSNKLAKFTGLLLTLQKPMVEILDDWLGSNTSHGDFTKKSKTIMPSSSSRLFAQQPVSPIARLSPPELRHLIRALFQNTELRRSVLEKIKD